ncbi:MAG: hypothetical protein ACYCTE_16265 [Acidimicrobiales bacterium]
MLLAAAELGSDEIAERLTAWTHMGPHRICAGRWIADLITSAQAGRTSGLASVR